MGEEVIFLWGGGEERNPFLSSQMYNVSDHYFAALDTVRATGAPDRCRLGKAGGSEAIRNPHPGISRIFNRI